MVFELQPRRDSAEQHQFLVLADPQTQTRTETGYFNDETVPDVQALLKSRAGVPTFGVGCGDLMFDDLSLFPEYERGVTAMGVPFFQVIGNHDLDLLGRSDEDRQPHVSSTASARPTTPSMSAPSTTWCWTM